MERVSIPAIPVMLPRLSGVCSMATKKSRPIPPSDGQPSTGHKASFIEDREVAALLVGNEQPVPPKVGGRYKVNGVWVNANGEPLENQNDE